jgi:dihydroorotate dehydrogenase (NAD+) catalytic subunit
MAKKRLPREAGSLSVKIGSLRLKNPVAVASGTFGYAQELADFIDLSRLGAIFTKTITLKPRTGNPPPRIAETASGILNSIGLENVGLEIFLEEKLPFLRKQGVPIIVSIGAQAPDEFAELTRRLVPVKGISGLELNLSCPNIRRDPQVIRKNLRLIAQDEKATYEVVRAAKKQARVLLIAKLSPCVTDILSVAGAAKRAGADAISLVNTFPAMAIDINSRRPKLGNIVGGLSGPAIKPIALKLVWEVATRLNIPVIGQGGIMDWKDALEFILAGSSAICLGTATLVNPGAALEIIAGLKEYLSKEKISSISSLIGRVRL